MIYPKKEGLDFYILDTDMSEDLKIKILTGNHGLAGFAVFVKLLELIYRDRGYFINFNKDAFEVFTIDYRISKDELLSILETCFDKELFDRSIYEKYNILTSERIQKNFFRSCKRRSVVRYFKEIFLIKNNDAIPSNIEIAFYTLDSNKKCKYDDTFLIDREKFNKNEENEKNSDSVHANDDNVNTNSDNVHANDDNVNNDRQSKSKSKSKKERTNTRTHARENYLPSKFNPPNVDEVQEYAESINLFFDANKFVDYYEATGWKIGKDHKPMEDWKATVRMWKKNKGEPINGTTVKIPNKSNYATKGDITSKRERFWQEQGLDAKGISGDP